MYRRFRGRCTQRRWCSSRSLIDPIAVMLDGGSFEEGAVQMVQLTVMAMAMMCSTMEPTRHDLMAKEHDSG
jgi:hypothetical protein